MDTTPSYRPDGFWCCAQLTMAAAEFEATPLQEYTLDANNDDQPSSDIQSNETVSRSAMLAIESNLNVLECMGGACDRDDALALAARLSNIGKTGDVWEESASRAIGLMSKGGAKKDDLTKLAMEATNQMNNDALVRSEPLSSFHKMRLSMRAAGDFRQAAENRATVRRILPLLKQRGMPVHDETRERQLRHERNALIHSLIGGELSRERAWMIHPDSTALLAWNIMLVLCLVGLIVAVPLRCAFRRAQPLWIWAFYYCDCVFCLDVAVSLATGFFDGPVVCMAPKRAALNYVRRWFLWEIGTIIPFASIGDMLVAPSSNDSRGRPHNPTAWVTWQLLSLLKLTKLRRLHAQLIDPLEEKAIDAHIVSRVTVSLFKLTATYFVIVHLVGCGYWALSKLTEPRWSAHRDWTDDEWRSSGPAQRSFCPHYKVRSKLLSGQYAESFHWATYATYAGLSTSKGVGSMPLKRPQTNYETFCLMVGVMVLASIIGTFSALIDEFRGGNRERRDTLRELDQYFRARYVPEDTRITTRRYVLFLLDRKILTGSSAAKRILDQLPTDLRHHVRGAAKMGFLPSSTFFQPFADATKRHIAAKLVTFVYHPLQIVRAQGDECLGVSLIAYGSLMIFVRASPWPKALNFLEQFDTFGHETLLRPQDKPRNFYSAVTRDFAELFVLKARDVFDLYEFDHNFRRSYNAGATIARDELCQLMANIILRPFFKQRVRRWRRSASQSPVTAFGASLPIALARETHRTKAPRRPQAFRRSTFVLKFNNKRVNNRLAPFSALLGPATSVMPLETTCQTNYYRRSSLFRPTSADTGAANIPAGRLDFAPSGQCPETECSSSSAAETSSFGSQQRVPDA